MLVFCLSTMLMKTRELNRSLHDVDEKKGGKAFDHGVLLGSVADEILSGSSSGCLLRSALSRHAVSRSQDGNGAPMSQPDESHPVKQPGNQPAKEFSLGVGKCGTTRDE